MRDRWRGSRLAGWVVVGLAASGVVARAQGGSVANLDYELGYVAAQEISSFGHAIVGVLIKPHAHGRSICYRAHRPDVPALDITYLNDYATAPAGAATQYRHGHQYGNVVQEHAHYYAGDHDHQPGSPFDYLAAYEHYQRTEKAGEFDEAEFVLDRFDRKVPVYHIEGKSQPKVRRRADAPSKSKDVPLFRIHNEGKPKGRRRKQAATSEPATNADAEGNTKPAARQETEAANAAASDEAVATAGAESEDATAAAEQESGVDEQRAGQAVIVGADEGSGRYVDRYRERRREARERFDARTGNRLDPAHNRKEMRAN